MKWFRHFLLTATAVVAAAVSAADEPVLRIGYSDWPGWTAWEIADKKGFFAKHGVNVKLEWFEYGPQMDAFAVGRIDAAGISNGDADGAQRLRRTQHHHHDQRLFQRQ